MASSNRIFFGIVDDSQLNIINKSFFLFNGEYFISFNALCTIFSVLFGGRNLRERLVTVATAELLHSTAFKTENQRIKYLFSMFKME